jgi:hypothetical protein
MGFLLFVGGYVIARSEATRQSVSFPSGKDTDSHASLLTGSEWHFKGARGFFLPIVGADAHIGPPFTGNTIVYRAAG